MMLYLAMLEAIMLQEMERQQDPSVLVFQLPYGILEDEPVMAKLLERPQPSWKHLPRGKAIRVGSSGIVTFRSRPPKVFYVRGGDKPMPHLQMGGA